MFPIFIFRSCASILIYLNCLTNASVFLPVIFHAKLYSKKHIIVNITVCKDINKQNVWCKKSLQFPQTFFFHSSLNPKTKYKPLHSKFSSTIFCIPTSWSTLLLAIVPSKYNDNPISWEVNLDWLVSGPTNTQLIEDWCKFSNGSYILSRD